MRTLVLGTAGHIDHGKTALVRALTGVDTDRLPEEKRRGITIDLGFADLTLPSGDRIGIVDVPGHEAFVRNMLAGATGVDLALLVIAADEGVMPQTREHLAILELLGVQGGVIALTKIDLVEPEWLELVGDEVREHVAGGSLGSAPVVPVSARTGAGLPDLLAALGTAAGAVSQPEASDLFRMPIDRVFTVRGTGTVVTGTVWSGSAHREQSLRLLPAESIVRVRGLQGFGEDRESIRAGERAAIALAGMNRSDLQRGDVLVAGEGWAPASMITASLRVLPEAARPITQRQRVRFHLGAAEVLARVVLLEGDELEPGAEAWAQLRLEGQAVARAGDRFVLRSYSPVTTIAGGVVVEPVAGKRKRLDTDARRRLERIPGKPAAAVQACVVGAGWRGVRRSKLPVLTPHPPEVIAEALAASTEFLDLDGTLVDAALLEETRTRITKALDAYHAAEPIAAGAGIDELRRVLPPEAAAGLFDAAVRTLTDEGALAHEGAVVRRADFAPRLTGDQERAITQLLEVFASAGLTPPAPAELPTELATRADLDRLVRLLERRGRLVQLGPGVWLDAGSFDDAVRRAHAAFPPGASVTTGEFKDLFGITRKYLIPLLERFDRTGVTVRKGDVRVLSEPSTR